ncbi:uncharacterized protein DDB_G0271670-like isoform X2 [Onychostoma macrolepis]|uniref:uncharacterized protein DDB_G0271670-like isoform X2 n=1 Tax=Onychostoma macrolepis TaxID=369639 RepID=UPI00272ADCC9|nr:uncharacterized protein DDB_G0271670-like isoform X2 [Onychostoma macrolepis]
MKIIWTFTLLMIPGVLSSISVTGYSGGGVRIRDLSEGDSGTYYCGTDVSWDIDSYTEVNLKVITADCCEKSISLSAAAGGSVNISCKYPQSHRTDVKFVCRRSGSDLCAEETSVKESRTWTAAGQIQLYDDREQQLLTGSISHVTRQHSAEYWCGVQSDEGHKSFITRVLISVTETTVAPPSSSSSTTSTPPSSSSSSSSSSASSVSSVTSPLITTVSKESSSAGLSLIISLVLVLLLLIIVCLLVLFFSCKKHQSQGGKSSSQAGAAKHGVVSNTGCDYEEITHKQLPTNPSDSSNTVYATAQLPTNPSDSSNTVYATAQLPTNPSDSSNTVYATAQLPTNPSDSSNTVYATAQLPTNPSDSSNTVYTTAQKATGDSQILITSAEDLNYSVVNFHKKADCPDSVRLRNN